VNSLKQPEAVRRHFLSLWGQVQELQVNELMTDRHLFEKPTACRCSADDGTFRVVDGVAHEELLTAPTHCFKF
jgi:hypothetical protein